MRRSLLLVLVLACSPTVESFNTTGGNGTISGVVSLADGKDPSQITIVALSHGVVGLRQETQASTTGQFAFSLAPGEYDLQATAPGYQLASHSNVLVTSAATTSVDKLVLPQLPDTNPPTLVSFTAPAFVGTPSVNLVVTGEDAEYIGADLSLALSNQPFDCKQGTYNYNFAGCTVTPCQTIISGWPLDSGPDGPRTVYACLQDAAGLTTIAPSALTVTIDSVPPPAVLGLAAEASSHQFQVTFGAVSGVVSGVSNYLIDYSTDPTFATGVETVTVPPPKAGWTITGVSNRTVYYFRVHTVSGSGLQTTSASVSAVAGVSGFQLQNQGVTGVDATPVGMLVDHNRLWAMTSVNLGSLTSPAHYMALSQCPIGQFDCTNRSSWSLVGYPFYIPGLSPNTSLDTGAAMARFTHAQAPSSGVPAWQDSLMAIVTSADSTPDFYVNLGVCNQAYDCTNSGYWSAYALDGVVSPSINNIKMAPLSLVANARHIFAAYEFDTFPANTAVKLKVCPRSGQCANPTGSNPAYFPAWATVSPGVALPTATVTAGLSAVAIDAGYFLAVAPDVTQPTKIVGCLAGQDCTLAGGYFTPIQIPGSGGFVPHLAATGVALVHELLSFREPGDFEVRAGGWLPDRCELDERWNAHDVEFLSAVRPHLRRGAPIRVSRGLHGAHLDHVLLRKP